MLSTLLVIAGVLVGLLLLLSLIVHLSARPATRGETTATRTPSWVADAGQPHPDAWSPLSTPSTQIRALRCPRRPDHHRRWPRGRGPPRYAPGDDHRPAAGAGVP